MSREKPLIAADSADLINILKSFAKLPAKAQTDYLSLFYSQNSHQDFGKMIGKTWILKHLCIEYVWPISFHVPPPSLTFGYSHLSCLQIVRLETPEFRSRYTENNYLWTILKASNSHGFRLFYLTLWLYLYSKLTLLPVPFYFSTRLLVIKISRRSLILFYLGPRISYLFSCQTSVVLLFLPV